MSDNSNIGWTNATWNPVTGCTRVSAGCDHCYAVRQTRRMEGAAKGAIGKGHLRRTAEKYAGLTSRNAKGDLHFNGTVRCHDDELYRPLHWRTPRMIFVSSMSDLFHESVPDEFILKVLGTCALCPQHTFQVLTKRPQRAASLLDPLSDVIDFATRIAETSGLVSPLECECAMPLGNVWIGTSFEDQKTADERHGYLLRVPAAVLFLSLEPLLGTIDLSRSHPCGYYCDESVGHVDHGFDTARGGIDWVIVGGESGPGHRTMDLAWLESIVDQCRAAGVAIYVKQDSGPRPGKQGRIPDSLWIQEWPRRETVVPG